MSLCVEAFKNHSGSLISDTDCVQFVGMNMFGLLRQNSPEDHLFTRHTNVCAGLALFEQSGKAAGLLHVYSDAEHHPYGMFGHRLHVQNLWRQVSRQLPAGHYDAVFFGGRKPKNGSPELNFTDGDTDPFIQMAFVSSYWMHTALFETVSALPYITVRADYRFMDAPHDALLSRQSGTLYIGNDNAPLPSNTYKPRPQTRATRVVQGWSLTL